MPTRAQLVSRIRALELSRAERAAREAERRRSPVCTCPKSVRVHPIIDTTRPESEWPEQVRCTVCHKYPMPIILYDRPAGDVADVAGEGDDGTGDALPVVADDSPAAVADTGSITVY